MCHSSRSEITRILVQLQSGDIQQRQATDHLFDLVYEQLHQLAASLMRRERPDHTLRPTALVHEAYLRLVDASRIEWQSRAHFFGVAARAMRQLLVDHARRRAAVKRKGDRERVTLDPALGVQATTDVDLLRLDEILNQLNEMDARMARVAELRIFTGMRIKDVAHVLGVTSRIVGNDWSAAKMWISSELTKGYHAQ